MLVAVGVRPATAGRRGRPASPSIPRPAPRRTSTPPATRPPYDPVSAARPSAHWEAAARQGAAAARAMLGLPERAEAPPLVWSDQHGVRIQRVGDPRGADATQGLTPDLRPRRPARRRRAHRPTQATLRPRAAASTPRSRRPHDPHRPDRRRRLPRATATASHAAPGVFALNGDIAELVGPGTDEQLRAAARACPAGAILLFDADTGEEVDP